MLDKLAAVEAKYSQIEARLAAPETYGDPALVARLNKEQTQLQPLVDAYRAYQRTLEARDQAQALMEDPEMRQLAQEGRLRELDGPTARYDSVLRPHSHIRCLRCGALADAGTPYDPALDQGDVARGWTVRGHDLLFHGVCPACAEKIENQIY